MSIFDRRVETMPRDQMVELQLNRMRKMVDYCMENVPFYTRQLSDAGIHSGSDIQSLKDIEKIPFTTKDDLRDNYPDGFLAVPRNKIARIHASSGTTGKPTLGYYTKQDMRTWAEASARVLCLNNIETDDVLQISVGYGLFTGALGFHQGAELIGCTIVPASTGNTQKQLVMLHDVGVTALMATPSYATYLADLINQSSVSRTEYKIAKVLLGAERCTNSMRNTIEKKLGVPTFDNYGLTECFGPGVAGECECHCGMHISEDLFYPEIINPESGEALSEGEEGELVFTSLYREAMPLLRYRTRDITSLNFGICDCGRTSVRMKAPYARTDDMIVFKGVNVFPSQIECAIDGIEGLSPHYHLKLEREGYQDTATLFVELEEPLELYSTNKAQAINEQLQKRLNEIIIVKLKTKLVNPGTLQRFTGKAKRVEDLRYSHESTGQ